MSYNTYKLKNGLRIIHLDSESPVVYCGYAVACGARHENNDEFGLAHFCEHTTFKGTEHLSSLRVINALEQYGGDLNAFTTKEETFYYAAILREHFQKAVKLLTEIVFHSIYPQQEIDKEVEVICDEIESYLDTPSDLIYDEFENEIFSNSSLGHSILGEADRVRNFTTADALAFTKRYYKPENCVFYVYGRVDFNKLIRVLEKETPSPTLSENAANNDTPETLKEANNTSDKPAQPEPLPTIEAETPADSCNPSRKGCCPSISRMITKDIDSHQSHVMIGTRIEKSIEGKEAVTLALLNNILGGPSMNSRLNLALREKRGLVYSVDSSITSYSDATLWTVYFGCNHEDVRRCLRLVHGEINRIQQNDLSAATLKKARQQLKGQIALASENRENFAIDMAKLYLRRGKLKSNEATFAILDTITAEDLREAATKYLTKESLLTLIMK